MVNMARNDFNSNDEKIWKLTAYEEIRLPQEIIMDNTEIGVSPRSLHRELMCPICLDMLNITMTTRECLHRFCQECITTALRTSNKECPTCRKKLISKRCLRADPNFDKLIAKIYPNREEFDKHQESKLSSIIRSAPECEVILRALHTPTDSKKTRFMKTSLNATIEHITKYLAMRPDAMQAPCVGNEEELATICVCADSSRGQYESLNNSSTLEEIKKKYWRDNKPLELYYCYTLR